MNCGSARMRYGDIEGILEVKRIVLKNQKATFFILGPPIMMKTFKNYFFSIKVPIVRVITDDWE